MPSSEFFAQFQLRFTNWIRWCTETASEPSSPCNSIEGRYKSPQIWDEARPNMGLLNPINKWDAMALQRAYVSMPPDERRVIKFMYFRPHWRREWIAQKLDVHHSKLGERLHIAKCCMCGVLDTQERGEYSSRTEHSQTPLMEALSS